jgi:hypothetical protein
MNLARVGGALHFTLLYPRACRAESLRYRDKISGMGPTAAASLRTRRAKSRLRASAADPSPVTARANYGTAALVSTRKSWFCNSRNYPPGDCISRGWGGYTIHYWSLAVEEHFYLLWPAALVILGKTRAQWFAVSLAGATAVWRTWDFSSALVRSIDSGIAVRSPHGHTAGCASIRLRWSVDLGIRRSRHSPELSL